MLLFTTRDANTTDLVDTAAAADWASCRISKHVVHNGVRTAWRRPTTKQYKCRTADGRHRGRLK